MSEAKPAPSNPPQSQAAGQAARDDPQGPHPAQVDPERLADKVYRLMMSDLRLARARGEALERHGRR
jgi:hypothetical protein